MPTVYDLTREELGARLVAWGEPTYRAAQVWSQLWKRGATYDEMTNVPPALRGRLAEGFPVGIEVLTERDADRGATRKVLLRLGGEHVVETVLMGYPDRVTVCVSSQVGCAMGCTFCATGQMGLEHNLTAGEIAAQVVWARRSARDLPSSTPQRLGNVVFMGMGEAIGGCLLPRSTNTSSGPSTMTSVVVTPLLYLDGGTGCVAVPTREGFERGTSGDPLRVERRRCACHQVFGDGLADLVYVQGFTSHVDFNWDSPYLARFLRGLGQQARVIHTDRRGWGCSDRFSPGDVAPLEVQVDDVVSVIDEAGSERAVIFGSWDTGLTAMLFAATYPERTAGLVLCDPFATFCASEETPWMYTETQWEEICDNVRATWGTPRYQEDWFTDEREHRDWFVPWSRASVAPGALVAETRAFYRIDARAILPSIHVPTLVVGLPNEEDDQSSRNAAFIAERIAGARLVEPPTGDTAWFHWYGRASAILEEIGTLLASVGEEQASFDRVLATVLLTDIVDSTATAATIGDAKWRALLEEHDRIAKGIIGRFRGTYVRGTGDGLLATFDGPARGVRCAEALVEAMKPLAIEIRAGLHTGEIEYGGHDLAGVGVNIGARVGAMAGTSEVWVSSTVKDLVAGSGLVFEDAGEHELRGVPDRWHLYRVVA